MGLAPSGRARAGEAARPLSSEVAPRRTRGGRDSGAEVVRASTGRHSRIAPRTAGAEVRSGPRRGRPP